MVEVRREGDDLRVMTSEAKAILLARARHQPRLFGTELPEEDLGGTQLRLIEDDLEKLARRASFTVLFHAGGERGRSYLCERASSGS